MVTNDLKAEKEKTRKLVSALVDASEKENKLTISEAARRALEIDLRIEKQGSTELTGRLARSQEELSAERTKVDELRKQLEAANAQKESLQVTLVDWEQANCRLRTSLAALVDTIPEEKVEAKPTAATRGQRMCLLRNSVVY